MENSSEKVKAIISLNYFENNLSDFLALIPDQPLVAGHRSSCSNFLVDYLWR